MPGWAGSLRNGQRGTVPSWRRRRSLANAGSEPESAIMGWFGFCCDECGAVLSHLLLCSEGFMTELTCSPNPAESSTLI